MFELQDGDPGGQAARAAGIVRPHAGGRAGPSAPPAGGLRGPEVQESAVSLQLFRRGGVPGHVLQRSAARRQREGSNTHTGCFSMSRKAPPEPLFQGCYVIESRRKTVPMSRILGILPRTEYFVAGKFRGCTSVSSAVLKSPQCFAHGPISKIFGGKFKARPLI